MSIKDRILKRRERFAYERAHWVDADPEESWFYLMTYSATTCIRWY